MIFYNVESQFKGYLPRALPYSRAQEVCSLGDPHSFGTTIGAEVNMAIPVVPGCDGE